MGTPSNVKTEKRYEIISTRISLRNLFQSFRREITTCYKKVKREAQALSIGRVTYASPVHVF